MLNNELKLQGQEIALRKGIYKQQRDLSSLLDLHSQQARKEYQGHKLDLRIDPSSSSFYLLTNYSSMRKNHYNSNLIFNKANKQMNHSWNSVTQNANVKSFP
jgi:hypothetical protein